MLAELTEIGLFGALDIVLMSVLVYFALLWMWHSRAAKALQGLLIVGGVYLAASMLDLALTTAVLETFFAVAAIAVIVIFREELRQAFERLAHWRPLRQRAQADSGNVDVGVVARALADLARDRIGALVVVRGKAPLEPHLKGGVLLDGRISEALIKSLFEPHSIGHDGALVIEDGRIRRFSCHLPLSANFDQIGLFGTRHAAGLGLSEHTDALCVIVSEERGTITLAREGALDQVEEPDELAHALAEYWVPEQRPSWIELVRGDLKLKVSAVAIALLLWLVLVFGAGVTARERSVPVVVLGASSAAQQLDVDPPRVRVRLEGTRRAFFLAGGREAKVTLSATGQKGPVERYRVSEAQLSLPRGIRAVWIRPPQVKVTIRPAAPAK